MKIRFLTIYNTVHFEPVSGWDEAQKIINELIEDPEVFSSEVVE